MKKITSAMAKKILDQLDERKDYLLNKENRDYTYSMVEGESNPVIPEYDYKGLGAEIAVINDKVMRLKHAVNFANVNAKITCGGKEYSVDEILVRMAQLNRRKDHYDTMREIPERTRLKGERLYGSTERVFLEYTCANFDLQWADNEYNVISKEIMELQIGLDRFNQTFEFDVDEDLVDAVN